MATPAKNRGFTLVEIMIVVLIIGILAMMARVAVYRIMLRAKATTYLNDCRVFAAAFTQYAHEKGNFPPDNGAHSYPPEMTSYIKRDPWMRETPLGGYYDWDNINAWNSFNVHFAAAIRINGCTMTIEQLSLIDKWIDDGNLATGNFRVPDPWGTAFYIIEQ